MVEEEEPFSINKNRTEAIIFADRWYTQEGDCDGGDDDGDHLFFRSIQCPETDTFRTSFCWNIDDDVQCIKCIKFFFFFSLSMVPKNGKKRIFYCQ